MKSRVLGYQKAQIFKSQCIIPIFPENKYLWKHNRKAIISVGLVAAKVQWYGSCVSSMSATDVKEQCFFLMTVTDICPLKAKCQQSTYIGKCR